MIDPSSIARPAARAMAVIAAALWIQAEAPAQGVAPNVVLIVLDDIGYGDIGVYDAPDIRTPDASWYHPVMDDLGHKSRLPRSNDQVILTGAEAGRGWTMHISEGDLAMSLAIAEDRTAFVVFGECIREEETRP